ncbi:MAG: hypothetical protein KJ070_09585 [Verrucomicrobia bacterium]|nr:hypothetical protein [Verrucomicrobiota bacterium]
MNNQITSPRTAKSSHALTVAVLLCCAAALSLPTVSLAGRGHDDHRGQGKHKVARVLPPHREAHGTTYSDLAGAWWNWALNQPPDRNPILDGTREFAAQGQDEDWGQGKKILFLAGNFGGETVRHCTVPKGKALFFPLANNIYISPEEGSVEDIRAGANAATDPVSLLECIIDGVPVAVLFAYRAQSPPGGSPFEIRPGSTTEVLFGVPARGPAPAVADGYWLLVELGDGKEHVIEFRAKVGDVDEPTFELSMKYHLTVEKDNRRDRDGDD